jgi:hypothetical protein
MSEKPPSEAPPHKGGSQRLRELFGLAFNYANNPIAITGIVITTVAGLSIVTFLLIEATGGLHNPYVNIFAYLILPAVFLLGLLLIPLGMWRRRRQLVSAGISEVERLRFPRLDFNSPQLRRVATLVLALTAANVVIFGFSSFLAVEHMETVEFCGTTCHSLMQPEYTAYQQSPHSRVTCVECHIGPGASWFVRSKVDGLRQVWHTLRDTYPRPITTPLETLRPARETCEQCHWPAKHYGDKIRFFARFAEDEANTPSYTAMLFKTGGGSLDLGRHGGIHWWHIYSDNRIRFAADESREEVYWVELTTREGEVRVYTRDGDELPPPAELEARTRLMDCIDCHNRPTHLMRVPSKALDEVLETRPELVALPYFKREAMAAVATDGYATHAEGVAAVRDKVLGYYQESHPDLWRQRQQVVESGADEASRVYARSFFPEMKTSWQTHPNHIGHEDSPGCFRCHDEELATADGEHVISIDCEQCHAFLVDGADAPPDLAALVNGG